MKKSLLLFAMSFGLTAPPILAATNVTGNLLDSRWNLAGSPYHIQGAVLIPAGVSIQVEPGVQVVLDGPAALDVSGTLIANGTAAYPVMFDMRSGGMSGRIWVKGGEIRATNTKFFGGVLAATNAVVNIQASEVAHGGGPYLMGSTRAVFNNNKIYGNACGATLDGDGVQADFQFNTIVQNTYGLQYKKASALVFVNNSIHSNQSYQVVNASGAPLVVDGNFWGTTDPASVRVNGNVDLGSPKALKDVLRAYLKTQLPSLPAGKSAAVAKEIKAEKSAVAANARKADALRKDAAAAEARAARQKKLAEEKAILDAKAKELAEKRAAERKAKAEELAKQKAEAAEALAKKKAEAAEALAKKKAEAAEALAKKKAEAAEAAQKKEDEKKAAAAPAAPAAELDLSAPAETAAPQATPEPTAAAPALDVPMAPVDSIPAVGPAAAPASASPAQSTLEIPTAPVETVTTPEPTPAPAVGAPAASDIPSLEIPAPPMGSASDLFNPADIPAPPSGATPDLGASLDIPAPAAVEAVPAPVESAPAAKVEAAPVATPVPTAASAPANTVPPALPDGDFGPPPDMGNLDLPPMSDTTPAAPTDMDLPPVDDLGKLDLDLK